MSSCWHSDAERAGISNAIDNGTIQAKKYVRVRLCELTALTTYAPTCRKVAHPATALTSTNDGGQFDTFDIRGFLTVITEGPCRLCGE